MTFYLKYRPQKISELDLEEVREELTKLLSSGKVPHALLFAGPKGSGKTSSARIIAKAINCLQRGSKTARQLDSGTAGQRDSKKKTAKLPSCQAAKLIEPCNKCRICKSITAGTALDLIEIDAASNRGIDDIRNLRERIKLSPAEARYKVYVVDECHMLTPQAFNALLKTLEEPPAHAVFILCTTQPQSLPETVISRCLRFDFKKATPAEIGRSLKRIVNGEKLKVEKGVLAKIAQLSDGSFRDATKILEQLSFSGKKIKISDIKTQLGFPEELLKKIIQADIVEILSWTVENSKKGIDWRFLIKEMLEILHQWLLSNYGLAEKPLELDLNNEKIQDLILLLEKAGQETKRAEIPELPLEMMAIKWWQDRLGEPEEALEEKKKRGGGPVNLDWEKVLKAVRPLNHSVEALLRSARPKNINGDLLTIEVFYKFHKGRLEDRVYKKLVEEAVAKVLGRPLKVCYTLR